MPAAIRPGCLGWKIGIPAVKSPESLAEKRRNSALPSIWPRGEGVALDEVG
jgi:hypothetical protein